MGGGDLNLKKSWHPSTMKNQERVWKAEQQKADEDRKVAELQKELREEREREFLRKTAENSGAIEKKDDSKLDWMYKGAGGHVSREEYLLGRKIDKAFDQLVQEEEEDKSTAQGENSQNDQPVANKNTYVIEHEINPESVTRRGGGDVQVDMRRKLMEDPLLHIRKREEETKKQITHNPVKMKQLQMLIESIKKKKKKRKDSSSSDSDSSDSSDSEEEKKKKIKKSKKKKSKKKKKTSDKGEKRKKSKKGKKKKKKESSSDSSNSSDDGNDKNNTQHKNDIEMHGTSDRNQRDRAYNEHRNRSTDKNIERYRSPDRRSNQGFGYGYGRGKIRGRSRSREDRNVRQSRSRSREKRYGGSNRNASMNQEYRKNRSVSRERKQSKNQSRSRSRDQRRSRSPEARRGRSPESRRGKPKLTEKEMEKKRQEMMDAAKLRDEERKANVERYHEERKKEVAEEKNSEKFMKKHLTKATGVSMEDRVKSRVSSMQRGGDHMNSNFARK